MLTKAFVGTAFVALLLASAAHATSVTFTGSSGLWQEQRRSKSSGSNLIVTLANSSTATLPRPVRC